MGEVLEGLGDLLFSLLIGYMGALEFLYVARHLYHWSFRHAARNCEYDADEVKRHEEDLRQKLAAAAGREQAAGACAMQDGVLYRDGFRIDPQQREIDELKEQHKQQQAREMRRQEMEAELATQQRIEEETRRQLEEAEAKFNEQRKQAAETVESGRKLLEGEGKRESEQLWKDLEAEEAAASEHKLFEMERVREEEQRGRERAEAEREATENTRRTAEVERAYEQEQPSREQMAAETETEAEADAEAAANVRRLIEAELALVEAERQQELEEVAAAARERDLLEAALDDQIYEYEQQAAAVQTEALFSAERERERKQKLIEANARRFMEAEQQMVEVMETSQWRQHSVNLDSEPNTPAVEEPCVKKILTPHCGSAAEEALRTRTTVKTQIGQTHLDSYSLSSKPLLFPGVSDDGSSVDPASSLQSSFSTEEVTTGAEEGTRPAESIEFTQLERQEPDGEDNNIPSLQYTDEYLRSLDGIKQRPLVREDGSGRRRAYKKRRSSGSSNSSRDSRTSREDEIKMFTSLEEEEFQTGQSGGAGSSDFTPIKYTSEPTLKIKAHYRRHKRSPAKDTKASSESLRSSLEMLGEENTNPWGEVVPEHYKDTEYWKRKKTMSIDESEEQLESPPSTAYMPKAMSFEEATHFQNEQAIATLRKQQSQDNGEKQRTKSVRNQSEPSSPNATTNLIFSGEYTKAMDKDWHSGHFCCWQCDESLTGQRYVIRDDHPYCIKCYENVFANTCEECNKIIGIDSKDLSYKDKHWHEACFLCFKCHLSLVDKQFGAKADKIYCGNCYDAQFASRCDGCGEVFRAGTKKMEYKTRQWHENCFCCCVCKMAIGTKSFIPREQEIYCAGCYEEKFATRCIKCNKVITSGGVTYKNEPWHRECFTCTHCNITLAGQRFTSRDEKPYCAECFGELFAKRCTSCVKPITGIGGTRFISFEDRHWHHDCFVCASCKTSLVGRGFITDGPDIICPECAKQKLL